MNKNFVQNLYQGSRIELSLLEKFRYYHDRYGFLHTACSYIGRYNPRFWACVGPIVTRNFITHWEKSAHPKILNLGGGSHCILGCLTLDINPRADAYLDITERMPFLDSSIDAIFCEEVIEHIKPLAGLRVLGECLRILKPNGVLRLSTPDLNWFVSRLSERDGCDAINCIFYEHEHQYLYTRMALSEVCEKVGFVNVRHSYYQDNSSVLGYLDSHADRFHHPPEMSQYLEAQKPV